MTKTAELQVTTPSEREITITRIFDAPRRLVWDAWTIPQHMQKWLLGPPGWTMPICELDVRPGGRHRCVWRKQGGAEMEIAGLYREIVPPELLVTTESWGEDWPETVNTLLLTEENGKTKATLTILYTSQEVRDKVLQSGMAGGLSQSYANLDKHLQTMA